MLPHDAELAVLTTEAGRALLDQVARIPAPGPADLSRWRRLAPADLVAAAIRLAQARRKAAGKVDDPSALWLDPVGIEQSTAWTVARHKALRFAGTAPAVDLCAGLGGDALAIAAVSGGVLAVDRDPGMARRLAWNARAAGLADRLLPVQADAERFVVPPGCLLHVDPDRRAARPGRRAVDLEGYVPGPDTLLRLARETPGGAFKLGPASAFETLAAQVPGAEVEVVSLHGECKEATLWFGRLATPGVRRRATMLPAGATWTDQDGAASNPPPPSPSTGSFLQEPDPALVRAGLLDGFAAAHGLQRLDPAIDWLTGSRDCGSPWLVGFQVVQTLALDRKRLRHALADLGAGPVEVKTRGLGDAWRPDALRRELSGPGPQTLAVLLSRGRHGPGTAIIARRLNPTG